MLYDSIHVDLIQAMKAQEKEKTATLRMLIAALKNEKINAVKEKLDDPEVIKIIQKQVKQRQDSIDQYQKGDRNDLAEKEMAEIEILKKYLPVMMSEQDVENIIQTKKTELNITDKSGMGRLMGEIMKEVSGKADGNLVRQIVEKSLSSVE